MRTGVSFGVSSGDRQRLKAIVADGNRPQKHVWRARIILLSDGGLGTAAIMAETGKSKTCVWRWQERFMEEGVDGLLREKTRPPGIPPTSDDKVAEIVRLTQEPPPHEATHWTLRAMATLSGVVPSTVRGIWKAHGLSPHRWRAVQALERSEVRGEAARRGRALCRSARACGGALCRREVADPGAGPHPARPAAEEGPGAP
jgi:transposase